MTDTKPKDVCDAVHYGHTHVRISVCVRLQRCRKVLGVCRFSCDSMTGEPSPAFTAKSLDLILGSWNGVCRACHGLGCAVPAVPFTSGPDTRWVVKKLGRPQHYWGEKTPTSIVCSNICQSLNSVTCLHRNKY